MSRTPLPHRLLRVLGPLALTFTAGCAAAAGERALVARDDAAALREWSPRAERGDPAAQFLLGRDDVAAYTWYSLGVSLGHSGAQAQRELLAARLAPEEIESAEQNAAAWRLRHPQAMP